MDKFSGEKSLPLFLLFFFFFEIPEFFLLKLDPILKTQLKNYM